MTGLKILTDNEKKKIRNQWKNFKNNKPSYTQLTEFEIKNKTSILTNRSKISKFIEDVKESAWQLYEQNIYICLNEFLNILNTQDSLYSQKIYVVCQSLTQSNRSVTGKNFEKIIKFILEKEFKSHGVNIESQKANRRIDFLLKHNDKKVIISCKTTLRERIKQDDLLYNTHKYLFTIDKLSFNKDLNKKNAIKIVTLDKHLKKNTNIKTNFICYKQAFNDIGRILNV